MPLEYLSEMRQVSVVFINLIFASGADIDESDSLQEAFSIIYDSMHAFEGIAWSRESFSKCGLKMKKHQTFYPFPTLNGWM